MSKLLLIDGNSIMNRGYFALPKTLTAGSGIHTNAILGFLNVFFIQRLLAMYGYKA